MSKSAPLAKKAAASPRHALRNNDFIRKTGYRAQGPPRGTRALEADAQRKPELPFAAFDVVGAAECTRNGQESSRRHVGARIAKMRRVGKVVGFRPDLKVQTLSEPEVA